MGQRGFDRCGIGDVADLPAGAGKVPRLQQDLQCLLVDVVETDEPALVGEAHGRGQANAMRRAGDEYRFHDSDPTY